MKDINNKAIRGAWPRRNLPMATRMEFEKKSLF